MSERAAARQAGEEKAAAALAAAEQAATKKSQQTLAASKDPLYIFDGFSMAVQQFHKAKDIDPQLHGRVGACCAVRDELPQQGDAPTDRQRRPKTSWLVPRSVQGGGGRGDRDYDCSMEASVSAATTVKAVSMQWRFQGSPPEEVSHASSRVLLAVLLLLQPLLP